MIKKNLIFFESEVSAYPVEKFLRHYNYIIDSPASEIIITMLREQWNWTIFDQWASSIKHHLSVNGHTVYFLVNNTFNYKHVSDDIARSVFAVDFFLTDAVFRLRHDKSIILNTSWNSDSDKALFLSGKPDYYTRYQPVLYLDQIDRLKDFVYSYHGHTISDFRDLDIFYPNSPELLSKLASLSNSLDIEFQNRHYSGYPFDIDLFKNTAVSLVPEGVTDYHTSKMVSNETLENVNYYYSELDNPFITEKTYKAILNHHPFIILGQVNSNIYLENLGFRTFREYLKYPNYNEVEDLEERIQQGIENSVHFLDNYKKYKEEIDQDVIHNFNNIIAVTDQQWSKIPFFQDHAFLIDTYVQCSYELSIEE